MCTYFVSPKYAPIELLAPYIIDRTVLGYRSCLFTCILQFVCYYLLPEVSTVMCGTLIRSFRFSSEPSASLFILVIPKHRAWPYAKLPGISRMISTFGPARPVSDTRWAPPRKRRCVVTGPGRFQDRYLRQFLLTNLVVDGEQGLSRWRVNLPVLQRALPTLASFSAPAGASYPGPTLFIGGQNSAYIE